MNTCLRGAGVGNGWLPKITWIGRRDIDKRSTKDFRSIEMQKSMDLFLENNQVVRNKWSWIPSVENIYDYYNKSDVLVIPSFYEGLPLVLCEAMLSGCFVIASSNTDLMLSGCCVRSIKV